MSEIEKGYYCSECGALVKRYQHNLTKGLVDTLAIFAKQVRKNKKKNKVHLYNETNLNYTQTCNFKKLQYFKMVKKWEDAEGSTKTGYWQLTRIGALFLKGKIVVPKKVITFRGEIDELSDEKVSIFNYGEKGEYWQKEFSPKKEIKKNEN